MYPIWLHDVEIWSLLGPDHLLQESSFFWSLKIVLYVSGWVFTLFILLQNASDISWWDWWWRRICLSSSAQRIQIILTRSPPPFAEMQLHTCRNLHCASLLLADTKPCSAASFSAMYYRFRLFFPEVLLPLLFSPNLVIHWWLWSPEKLDQRCSQSVPESCIFLPLLTLLYIFWFQREVSFLGQLLRLSLFLCVGAHQIWSTTPKLPTTVD